MNSIRNLFVLTVVLTLMLSMVAVSAFAQSFDIEDADPVVAGSASTNVTLLRGTFEGIGADGDTLVAIRLKSCIESAFAVNQLTVVHKRGATSTTIATQAITGAFAEDVELNLTGLTRPVEDGDSLIFRVNIWTDSTLANAGDYDGTGLELTILPDGVDISNNGLASLANTHSDGTAGTAGYGHNPGWDPLACTGTYTGSLDLDGPDFTTNFFTHVDSTNCNANTVFNIGDKIILYIPSFSEQVDSTDVTADLSAFGLSATHNIPYVSGFGWLDTLRIDAGSLDVVPPFVVTATAADIYGNTTTNTVAFNTQFIDNIAPEIDSVKFLIYSNSVGPEDEAALTDQLVLWVYTGSSGFFEVDEVVADISRFASGEFAAELTDVTTGAGVWRLIFELEDAMAKDLAEGADSAKVAIVTAVDNGCNVAVDTVDFLPALDLEPPFFSDTEYITLDDADESGCTNLGDQVRVEADVSGNDDVAAVWGDLFRAGLGGASNAAFTNEGSGIWAYEITIGDADDPAQDPPTLQAKDANSDPVDADFDVWIYVEDDAGNVDSILTSDLLNTAGTAFVPLDTRRPLPIIQDSVMVEKLPGGELRLKWDKDADAGDAVNFYVYVDSTGSDINYNNVFGTTFNGEFPDPTYNYWYSGPLTHGKTYRFSIRTQDDCGNFEFNQAIFEGIPDAQAPTACVEFPTSGGQYGPNNPLTITAVSPDADIDAAFAVYRLIDKGDGTPGPWINYPGLSNAMTQDGQTFTETINLGTDASTEGEYELWVIGVDEVGNELSLDDADDACGVFTFTWNPNALVCDVLTINGAFAPQTSCGFDVTRDDLNEAVVSIVDPDAGDFYTVDVWVLEDDVRTRIDYATSTSLPYTFMFSALDWPVTQGTGEDAVLYVEITDERSGNNCNTEVDLCVPDEIAPMAWISDPFGYSCVPVMLSAGDPIEITVESDPAQFDEDDAVRAEFYYSMTGSTADGVLIGVEPFSGDEATVEWDNSGFEDGFVWLYAIVYDDVNNSYTTPFVKICIDGSLPVMEMMVKDAKFVADCGGEPMWRLGPEQNDGFITIQANLVNLDAIDITDPVYLFWSDVNDPDIFYYYDQNDSYQMDEANNSSIWVYTWEFADDLECGHTYRVRLAVRDGAGNWMFDYDGDGNFDDYTFDDAMDNGSGMLVHYDCEAPQPAFSLFQTDGDETRTWINPSEYLNGNYYVYSLPGEDITVQLMTIPADDSCEVAKVDYYFCEQFVGSSTDYQSFWEITFNPVELGIYNLEDVQDFSDGCYLEAVMYDQVGNYSSDELGVYILDNQPASAYIIDPDDGDCVAGDVDLGLLIFDDQPVKKVVWYYWPVGGTDTTVIAEVSEPIVLDKAAGGGYGWHWDATWQTLNSVPNGDYVIAASVCDASDNFTPKEEAMVTVTVANGLPTVTLTSPENGGFFCGGDYFCAEVDANGGCPIEYVTFEFKSSFDDDWTSFDNSPDYQAPWCALLDDDGEIDRDGWYDFRAVVTNESGVTRFSEPIRLYYDDTDPRVELVTATVGEDVYDIENSNDPGIVVPINTPLITFRIFAMDDQSVNGTSPTFNSGISSVCISIADSETQDVCLDVTPDANGFFDVPWDMSGFDITGTYTVYFTVYDNACGSTTVSVPVQFVDPAQPVGMIAGCWNGFVYGMTWADQDVIFEYTTDGTNWITIGGAIDATYEDAEQLLLPDGSYTSRYYSVYASPWQPADGDYDVRMRVEGGSAAPVLGINVSGGTCSVTSNPQDFGPGTIERNLENGCDNLEGIGRFGTNYGMPYGIAVAYNVPYDYFSFDIIQFNTLPQQGAMQQYAGPFYFDALTDGGFGWGHIFFFDADDAGEVAYSAEAHYDTYWVTRDFGTAGPVWYADGSVSVDIPAEATDYTGTENMAIAMWKSRMARPSISQDYLYTPVGDNNGMMTYISDVSCYQICMDDQQYAVVNMQYDADETTPTNQLRVAWWDGEGNWHTDNVFFPSTVRGFYQQDGQNWVEFAVTCFGNGEYDDAWYAVVKRTQYDGEQLITRVSVTPDCNGYTNGYPIFWYQLDETFTDALDFETLDIWMDGVPIFEGEHDDIYIYEATRTEKNHPTKSNPSTTLDGEADFVDVSWDPVSNRLLVEFYGWYYNDFDSWYYLPLDCGEHMMKVRIEDTQKRPQYIEDTFMVDCEAPDVNFDNYYTSSNPVIEFTIDDTQSGVAWGGVYVDVFFVTKANLDGTNGTPNETVEFIQTFFPAQIQDYLQEDGRTVRIPTSYDLENRRAIIAVVYDGYYEHQLTSDFFDWLGDIFETNIDISFGANDPSYYSAFDYYYFSGAYDCVGNWTDPFVQYLPVDAEAPVVDVDDSGSPIRIRITDKGSGLDEESIHIYSNGAEVTSEPVGSAAEVDAPGEWYFESTNDGGILWYYPDGDWEVRVADMSGNEVEVSGNGGGSIADGSVSGWAGPNPFDPAMDGSMTIHYSVGQGKVSTVTCAIYDQAGYLVTSLAPQSSASGSFSWSGTTSNGTMVANGVYFAVIQAQGSGGSSAVVKIAVVEK